MATSSLVKVRFDLPKEIYEQEKLLETEEYQLEEPVALPVDPAAREARFVEPVSVIAAVTVAVLVERLVNFALTKMGQGVLVDAREKPAHVSKIAGIPQGFILYIDPDGKSHDPIPAESAKGTLGDLLPKVLKG
jgi:hypothetical protein